MILLLGANRMKHVGILFFTRTCITSVWVCLLFEGICAGSSYWYVRHNDAIEDSIEDSIEDAIEYQHGGLWNQCMGLTKRTFCTTLVITHAAVQISRILLVVAVVVTGIHCVYMTMVMAQHRLNFKIMIMLSGFRVFIFSAGVVVYAVKGFSAHDTPGSSFYLAWVTIAVQISSLVLWTISYRKAGKLSKLQIFKAGLVL